MPSQSWKSSSNPLTIVYAKEDLPTSVTKSIFLAGPTPRGRGVPSWRPEALRILAGLDYDGHVFVPEPRNNMEFGDYVDQVEWETAALNAADVIVFWIPRDMSTLPGLTTNVEFGIWADSGKVILGYPEEAEHVRYLQHMADKLKVSSVQTLQDTLIRALEVLGDGALRTGGETQVPLLVWKHPTFERWYESHKKLGNRLDHAKVLWTFRVGAQRDWVFCWVLQVHVWIKEEERLKYNEFVFSRTDISSVALYYQEKSGVDHFWDTEVLLVREFRSPVRNSTGFISELPGGSAKKDTGETLKVALEEVEEETSLKLDPGVLREVGTRQMIGTLSAHTSTLFVGRLTKEERDKLVALDVAKTTFGVEADTEKTYVEVRTLREVVKSDSVDWSNLGMLLLGVLSEGALV